MTGIGLEAGAFGNCSCLSEHAGRCLQLRSHLTDAQFEALDPDDQECECVCHQSHDPMLDGDDPASFYTAQKS